MNIRATDRPTGRRSLKRRLKRLLTVWKHGRLEIKFNLLFYAIGDRERKKRGIGVRTVLAAAVVILTALDVEYAAVAAHLVNPRKQQHKKHQMCQRH